MFKPLQNASWFYTDLEKRSPQSTTHEMLEKGIAKSRIHKFSSRKKLNLENFRFDIVKIDKPFELPLTTSYKRDYAAPYDSVCPPKTVQENMPDPLFNRIPLNDFAFRRLIASEFKFMDDHLLNISPQRQKINCFRQIRNQHYSFG